MKAALSRRLEKLEVLNKTDLRGRESLWFGVPRMAILAAMDSQTRHRMKMALAALRAGEGDPLTHKNSMIEAIKQGYERHCANQGIDCEVGDE